MTSNMRETLAWLRDQGFIVGRAPLDCGHVPSIRDPENGATGVAYDGDRTMCYSCADAATRERMKTDERIVLYLNAEQITTWSGGAMARVVSRVSRKMRTPNSHFAHTRVFVRAIDLDGRHWYGSGPGEGMFIRLRATRVIPDPIATDRE